MPSTAQLAATFSAMVLEILKTMGDPVACADIANKQKQYSDTLIYSKTTDAWHLAMDADRIVGFVTNSTDPYEVANILMAVANAQKAKYYATLATEYGSKYKALWQECEDAMVAKDYTKAAALCAAMNATMYFVINATNAVGHARGQATYSRAIYNKYSKESVDEVFAKAALAADAYTIADKAAHLTDEVIKLINEETDFDACVALVLKHADECAAAEAAEAAKAAADKRAADAAKAAADKRAADAAKAAAKAAANKRAADAAKAAANAAANKRAADAAKAAADDIAWDSFMWTFGKK